MTEKMRYGPQTDAIEAMIRRLQAATPAEIEAIAQACDEARDDGYDCAYEGAREAAVEEGYLVALDAAWRSVKLAWNPEADDAEADSSAAWCAIWSAFTAILALHLIPRGEADLLVEPWADVFGRTWDDGK